MRPAFDPRCDLRAEVHDAGSITTFERDPATGALSPGEEGRARAMSVFLDGEERIGRGLVVDGSDSLVALHACSSCDLFECNLTKNHAARVRRFGPYVLWITVWSELRCFALERYREVFGADPSVLAEPDADDLSELDEPARSGEWSGREQPLSYDLDEAPDTPLARLCAWRGGPGVEAVAPPAEAIELGSTQAGARSLWLDAQPRADGRRAAYLPGVFVLPVWIIGPDVDAVVEEALGPG